MKDIFSPHTREVHINESRTLRLRITGIGQAIDILSFISASLKVLGPKNPEASMVFGEEGCAGTEKVEISYIQKEKAHHKNVYIVNLSPKLRSATTLIFNEDDVEQVDKRLKHLINKFDQEVKAVELKDKEKFDEYLLARSLEFHRMNSIHNLDLELSTDGVGQSKLQVKHPVISEPRSHANLQMVGRLNKVSSVEVHTLTIEEIQALNPKRELSMTKLIGEPMENRDGSYTASPEYLEQRRIILEGKRNTNDETGTP